MNIKTFTNYRSERWQKVSIPFKGGLLAAAMLLAQLTASPAMAAPTEVLNAPFQEVVTVSGKVVDDVDGQPIPGITLVANKKALGVTNEQGTFSVKVPKGTSVSFEMLGYTPAVRVAGTNLTNLTIRMVSSSSELNEVVVTALGIKREEKSLGYATTTVQGESLTDAASANWTDALSGKVAGLNMVRSGSGPGSSNKIILRGENNLTGDNEALIVLDGVVLNNSSGRRSANASDNVYGTGSDNMPVDYGSSINDINPEDIESVTVLKGPGASALYGQRGANGAIIITTKSGSTQKKGIGASFSSRAEMEQVNRFPELQGEYGQGLAGADYYSFGTSLDGASTSGTSSAYGPRFNGQSFFQYDPSTQTVGKERTPWTSYNNANDYFVNGSMFTNSVTLDGGSDKNTARFSVTDMRNTWIMPNTGYGRNNVALSFNSKVSDKLTIMTKVNYQNRRSDNMPAVGYGNQSIMYWYIFWQPNADLNWLKNYWVNGAEGVTIKYPFSSFPENPYAIAYEFLNTQDRNAVTGNVQASYNITKDLNLMVRASVDLGYETREQKRPFDAGTRLPKGSYRTQNMYNQESNLDYLLRYNKKINSDFNFSITAGGSILRNVYHRNSIAADSLNAPGIYSFSNTAGPLAISPLRTKYNFNSLLGLASLAYKDYLFLDLTGRNDWNSVLATPDRTENAGFFYPSANVSFVASDLFKFPSQVDMVKFRFSASQVGSGGTTPYLTSYNYPVAGAGNYPGGALTNPTLLPNANLKPLKTTTYETGLDLRFFKSRLTVDAAYYFGTTRNQHLRRIVDRSSGYNQVLINAGAVQNTGFELALNGTPFKSQRGLSWTVFGTFSTNKNKITELLDSNVILRNGPVAGGQIVARIGGSMGDMYGRGYVRSPDGQVVYDGSTGVAKITDEVVYLGNTIPKFRFSLGNDFKYKQFKLNVLFDAQIGAVAHSLTNYKMVEQGKLKSTLPGRYSGIIGNGVIQNTDGSYRTNDVLTFDLDAYYRSHMGADNAEGSTFSTDFVKFREASLYYTFTPKLVKRLGLQRVTAGVYGRNLFIWSPWPMFDPEFGTLAGTDIVQGFETGSFPSTRNMGVSLVVGF